MRVENRKRKNRSADVKAERNGIVLYDAYEGNDLIYPNMVRPSNAFWGEY